LRAVAHKYYHLGDKVGIASGGLGAYVAGQVDDGRKASDG
jgi:hypothetical protein